MTDREEIHQTRYIYLVLVICVAALGGCATVQAVTEAPEEFWLAAEAILWALWTDIVSVVEFLL